MEFHCSNASSFQVSSTLHLVLLELERHCHQHGLSPHHQLERMPPQSQTLLSVLLVMDLQHYTLCQPLSLLYPEIILHLQSWLQRSSDLPESLLCSKMSVLQHHCGSVAVLLTFSLVHVSAVLSEVISLDWMWLKVYCVPLVVIL